MLGRYVKVSTLILHQNSGVEFLPRAARMDVMLGCSAIMRFCCDVAVMSQDKVVMNETKVAC